MHAIRLHLSLVDTYLEVFGTRTTNGETEGENDTRKRQKHREGIDPPSN